MTIDALSLALGFAAAAPAAAALALAYRLMPRCENCGKPSLVLRRFERGNYKLPTCPSCIERTLRLERNG